MSLQTSPFFGWVRLHEIRGLWSTKEGWSGYWKITIYRPGNIIVSLKKKKKTGPSTERIDTQRVSQTEPIKYVSLSCHPHLDTCVANFTDRETPHLQYLRNLERISKL